jgi:hypothetical protein
MRRLQGWLVLITVSMALAAWGCGNTDKPAENKGDNSATPDQKDAAPKGNQSAKAKEPKQVMQEFLEAVRSGSDDRANSMLSKLAREKMAEIDLRLQPPASDTAQFSIDEVKFLDDNKEAAHVATTWTDQGPEGTPISDKIVWAMRKDPEGWCIVGMGANLIPDDDPVVFNLENPTEVRQKMAEVTEKIKKLQEGDDSAIRQAEQSDKPEETERR